MHSTFKQFSFLAAGPRRLLALLALGLLPAAAQAQLKITQATTPTTETFDGMGTASTSTAATVPAGFQLTAPTTTPPVYGSANATTTTQSTTYKSSFTAGGSYNFGDGGTSAATATDRALGFLASGTAGFGMPRSILLAVQNTTGSTIQDLQVKFDLEQYRINANAYTWSFFTSTDGTNWTSQSAGDYTFSAGANAYFYSPNPSLNNTTKTVALTGVNLANNGTLYLRWTMTGSSTNSQGIGLDNLVLTPTLGGGTPPAPTTATITTTPSTYASPYCTAGSTALSVAFTTSGTLTGTYKVQLSNATGTFPNNVTDNIIGTGTTSPIAATIPATTPSGTGYHVRVINDNPATYGTDTGQNLTVTPAATSNTVMVDQATASVSTTGTGAILTVTAANPSTYAWYYGTSASGPFTTAIASATTASYQVNGADFPGAGTYYLVAQATSTGCGTITGQSSAITVTVTPPAPPTPTLTLSSTTVPDFGSIAAGAAASGQDFTVTGSNLTGPVTITPPAGFEISTAGQPFACCTITLTPDGGSLNSTIEVRFAPTAAQPYGASLPVSSPDVSGLAVSLSGTGIAPVYPATVSTAATADLATTSFTSGGTVEADGGSPVTARGVVYAKTPSPTLGNSKTVDGAGTGTFASAITGLVPGTTYYVRAYATNGRGTTYGEELAVTTVAVPLAAEPSTPATLVATATTGSSLTLKVVGGDGTKHLLVGHLVSAVDATPTDATTYTGNTTFGQGTLLGTANYVVSADTARTITVSGLRPSTSYSFAVFEYNDNSTPFAENYLTTSPGTLTQATLAAPAAMLLEENFDYTAGAALTDNGWAAHSGGTTNAITVTSDAGLGYATYGASNISHAVTLTTTGQDVNRQFATVYARTPVYASFLVKMTSAGAADYFFHLGPTVLSSTFKARVYAKQGSTASKVVFGISGNGSVINYTTGEYNVGDTYLLVVKYLFDETGSTSQLFINPALNAEPATADVSSTETSSSPTDIGTVALRQGSSTPKQVFDGLRIGNSYRVVRTGLICLPPQPSFTASTVCAGLATAFTDASQTVEANATYAWDFDGDGKVDNTTIGNVNYTYAAAGTYTATLTITQGQCSDMYTQQVTVRPLPVPSFTASTVCAGAATTFTDASQPVDATATYAWDVNNDGTVDFTTKGSVSYTYAAAGTYTATLTITQGQCANTYSQQVTVRALPTASLSGTTTICAGSTASLAVRLTGVAPWMVSYSTDGGTTASTVTVAAADVSTSGVYTLAAQPTATTTYTLTSVTDANCTATTLTGTAKVTVNTAPVLTVPTVPVATAQAGLRGASVTFEATATGSTPAPTLAFTITQKGGAVVPITSPYVFPLGTTTVTATATNDCGTTSQTFTVTVQSPTVVSVLYENADKKVADNTIKPYLQLVNNSAAAIPYKELTVRYWLTVEDYAAVTATIDYAQLGTSGVQARYVPLTQPAQGALGYIEYSFTATSKLAAGASSGEIQSRLYKQTQTNFDESDDYSYGTNTAYIKNDRITVYRNGELIGGVEPDLVAPVQRLQVWAENKSQSTTSNTISTYLQVRNLGNQPVAYSDLTVRYWLSPEGTSPLKGFVDYAVLGASNVNITFGQAGTETYAELRFAAGLGSLNALSSTGNVQYRLAKTDWSNFNQANDFSYQVPGSAVENNHITVYQNGVLIYGQEPAGAKAVSSKLSQTATQVMTLAEAAPALPVALNGHPNPFASSTTLAFALEQDQAYELEIYDVSGRLVQRLQSGQATAGQLVQVEWQAPNLPAGLYLARLKTGDTVQQVKLVRQ